MTCPVTGIPSYLHKNNRPPDQDFDDGELYFRRIPPKGENFQDPDTIDAGRITPLSDLSGNRDKYCKYPEDVLYEWKRDSHQANYLSDWGIFSIKIEEIQKVEFKHGVTNTVYTLNVRHNPNECIYPHSIIQILEDGNSVEPPKLVRSMIREFLPEIATVVKYIS